MKYTNVAWLMMWTLLSAITEANEIEIRGRAAIEHRQFFSKGEQGQELYQPSVFVEPEFYKSFLDNQASVTLIPFLRLDALDNERTHGDIREFMARYYYETGDLEVRFGIGKVFWGVTESQHLVDIVNQTDAVEAVDGEDKLGQPMLHVSWYREWGTLDAFLLPYFRERTFAGEDGRLTMPGVDTSAARFESSEDNRHLDAAFRYSVRMSSWDAGLSYFQGTGRDPDFIYEGGRLVPYYRQIKQAGLDFQWLYGDWSWVAEALWRDTGSEEYAALTAGFEYSYVGVADSNMDLGLLMEFLRDSRGQAATTAWQQDLFVGARLAVNDQEGTEILFGVTQDLKNSDSRAVKIEASSRITNAWTWRINGWLFDGHDPQDPLHILHKDDYVEVGLEYYY
ncbi:hypothetical protein [Hahella ganghwensis]|uniref:hypothetical protein n=1 Tax=Hahella ganghwensis TaxID=286420 RepID=UPI000372454E|nr:hypothetical protein [Hahella ganghwensis]